MQEYTESDLSNFRKSPEGKRYRRIAWLVVSIFGACLLMVFILFKFESISSTISWFLNSLRAIFIGIGFAYILNPFDNALRKKFLHLFQKSKKISSQKAESIARVFGIVLSFIFGIGLLVAMLLLIIPSFIESFSKLDFSGGLAKIIQWVNSFSNSDDFLSKVVNQSIASLQNFLTTGLSNYITSISNVIISTGYQVITYVLDFIIAFIVALYALLEKENFTRSSKKMAYACFKPKTANTLLDIFRHGNYVFGNYISFKILDCVIVGILLFVFLSIFKIPYAPLISIFCAVTNFIPYLGPLIGGIPSGIIILLDDSSKIWAFLIIFLIIMITDANVLTPWILGDRTGVSPFWIICSLMIFKTIFGLFGGGMSIVGMAIGVPLFCVIDYFITRNVNRRIKAKDLAVKDLDYKEIEYYDTETNQFVLLSDDESHVSLLDRIKQAFKKVSGKFHK